MSCCREDAKRTAAAIDRSVSPEHSITEKARSVEEFLWSRCRSPEGLLYCFVMGGSLRRVTQEDIAAYAPDPDQLSQADLMYASEKMTVRRVNGMPQYLMQGIPLEDVEAYEDSAGCTGLYLSALCYRYRATADPAIPAMAHALVKALYSVYELGLQEQPGWIPKPYGFRCTKQSSMDNQCDYYQGLIRYHGMAPPADKERIARLLVDEMDYWIRNRYKMHQAYFGTWVDYASDEFYPGHWPLFFLPLCDAVWKITGGEKYRNEYEGLLGQTRIGPGKDPEYLLGKIRCFHRWHNEYCALLEQGAEPREMWLRGLRYQVDALAFAESNKIEPEYVRYDTSARHNKYAWLLPRAEEDRVDVEQQLAAYKLEDSLYSFPGYGETKPLAYRRQAFAIGNLAEWLETFWKGRLRGDW
jgi:hypothetical protein